MKKPILLLTVLALTQVACALTQTKKEQWTMYAKYPFAEKETKFGPYLDSKESAEELVVSNCISVLLYMAITRTPDSVRMVNETTGKETVYDCKKIREQHSKNK